MLFASTKTLYLRVKKGMLQQHHSILALMASKPHFHHHESKVSVFLSCGKPTPMTGRSRLRGKSRKQRHWCRAQNNVEM